MLYSSGGARHKTVLAVVMLILATAKAMFAIEEVAVKKIVLNGKAQAASFAFARYTRSIASGRAWKIFWQL